MAIDQNGTTGIPQTGGIPQSSNPTTSDTTTTNTTDTNNDLNFDLNLDFSEEPKKAETPVEAKTEKTPTIDLDLNLESNEPKAEEVKVETTPVVEEVKAEEAPVVEEVKAEETPVVEEVKAEQAPIIEEVKTEEAPAVEETKIENPAVEAPKAEEPKVEEKTPSSSFQDDKKIIESIKSIDAQKTETSNEIKIPVETQPIEIKQEEPKIETPKTQSNAFDLDSLLGGSPTQTTFSTPTTPLQNPTPTPNFNTTTPTQIETPTVSNTFSNPILNQVLPSITTPTTPTSTQNFTPQITPTIPTNTTPKKKNSIATYAIFFIVLIFGGGFIFKTMYPVEFNNLFAKSQPTIETTDSFQDQLDIPTEESTGSGEETTNNEITGDMENIGTIENPEFTGDTTIPTTTDELLTNETINNNTTENLITEIHGAAIENSGFDAFQELNEIIATGENTQELIDTLNFYNNEGKKFLVIGKQANNKEIIKYSLFMYKKSSDIVQSIENHEEINRAEIDQQIQQFSGYLEKLNKLSNAEILSTNSEPIQSEESTIPSTFENMSGEISQ